MAVWLFRAGSNGEYEQKFIDDKRIYLTWDDLDVDLKSFTEKTDLQSYLSSNFLGEYSKVGKLRNHAAQIWPMAHRMQKDDWIVLPSKMKSTIHIGKITGDYKYDSSLGSPYYHYRDVDWFAPDIPRSNFDQDILYSFGAFMTVCQIKRNDAEARLKTMYENNWVAPSISRISEIDSELSDSDSHLDTVDLEQYSDDLIAKFIIRKYKGHGMAEIVDEILKAYGFTTYVSPPGPDKGVDILAAPGSLGFGKPRICVQVKTQDTPLERTVLDQLIGSMQNHRADQGLLVSWSGFKSSIDREKANQFFNVRLWDSGSIINEIKKNYEKFSDDFRSEIPLKRVWTLADIVET